MPDTSSLLTSDQEIALSHRIRGRDKADAEMATAEMVVANYGFAKKLAHQYCRPGGMPYDDLLQDASMGLMMAARRYDPDTHGVRFSTYAGYWVRHCILIAIHDTLDLVRTPRYIYGLASTYRRRHAEISAGLDREATFDEVADSMGLRPRRRKILANAIAGRAVVSIDPDAVGPRRSAEETMAVEAELASMRAMIERLDPVSQYVIRRRYGIEADPLDMPTVARELRIHVMKVMAIEKAAIARLREMGGQVA